MDNRAKLVVRLLGSDVIVLNKFGDCIAEGSISEVEKDGFTLETGEAVLFRHIVEIDPENVTVRLNVAS